MHLAKRFNITSYCLLIHHLLLPLHQLTLLVPHLHSLAVAYLLSIRRYLKLLHLTTHLFQIYHRIPVIQD